MTQDHTHTHTHNHTPTEERTLTFPSNKKLSHLYGYRDQHMQRLEQLLAVVVIIKGNKVLVKGSKNQVAMAEAVLNALHTRLQRGLDVDLAEVDAAVVEDPAQPVEV